MSDDNSLIKLDTATRLLAEAKDLGDILQMNNLAEAAIAYAKAANLGTEAQNNAAEVALRAKKKAGEVLALLERATPQTANPSGQPKSDDGHGSTPYGEALEESGTSRQDANRWQTIAEMPDEAFNKYLEETKQEGKEITTAGAVRAAQMARGEDFQEQEVEPSLPLTTKAQSYLSLMFGIIKSAINDNDKDWLLSDDAMEYFDALHLPYESCKDWAMSGCKSIHEILCGMLDNCYQAPNFEEV